MQWVEENMADSPKYKPKDPEYFKKYYVNIIKPKLEAGKAEEVHDHISLPMLTVLLGTVIADINKYRLY